MESFFDIKVVPSSRRQLCKRDKNGQLKCYLKSAPEKNRANNELIQFLSDSLDLPKSSIEIVAGLTARKKRIKITAKISLKQLFEKLDIETQKTIYNG